MNKKLIEIKVFIQKNAEVMAQLEQIAQHDSLYGSWISDEIIEQQQELKRHAKRLNIISVEKPFFEEAEFKVHIRFDTFCSFVNLEECNESINVKEDETAHLYKIVIDNLVLQAVKRVPNEEHKKAQAI